MKIPTGGNVLDNFLWVCVFVCQINMKSPGLVGEGFPTNPRCALPAGGSKNLWSAGSGVGAKCEKKEECWNREERNTVTTFRNKTLCRPH
jgi:hypothetical protein